ncbi:MAG TPA: hypothetical protein ENN18_01000 [Proteobacteria bacterium]|nr:hypothetical protein [Pseudomonadota bacterium]
MNIVEFINHVLKEEIRRIQQAYEWKHTYLSFGLISGGIEFLGALCDRYDLNEGGHSEDRFNDALIRFFDPRYHYYAQRKKPFKLYSNLRCGMLHVVIPVDKLILGERANDSAKYVHLNKYRTMGNERLFLMAEDFYDDFRSACDKVINMINDKSILNLPEVIRASQKKNIMDPKNWTVC